MNGELPQGWIVQKILDIAPLVPTGVPEFAEEVEYFSTGSIQGTMHSPEGKFSFLKRPTRANRWTRDGDVLQARMQGTNKALLVDNNIVGRLFSTGFLQLRPNNQVCDARFLYHYLSSKQFLDERDSFATGSTQVALTDTGARQLSIPLPPLSEQGRIVAKLGKLLEKVESTRTRLERIPVLLKRFRQSVLAAACSGNLTINWRGRNPFPDVIEPEVCGSIFPETWSFTRIESLFSPTRKGIKTGPFGSALKKDEHQSSGIPVLGIENIGYMRFREGSKIHINFEKAEQLSEYDALPNDIIISRSGTVGEVCVVPSGLGEARISTNLMRVAISEKKMMPIFFCYLFNGSPFVLGQVQELCKGSTRDFINQNILKAIVFPFPPLPEQQEIVRRVEGLFALADRIEARYQKAKAQVDKLTQSILAKAFRGELVPQDPNDEPASELLNRIKAQKVEDRPRRVSIN